MLTFSRSHYFYYNNYFITDVTFFPLSLSFFRDCLYRLTSKCLVPFVVSSVLLLHSISCFFFVFVFFFWQPNLYPTVGLQTPGEVVDANFGQNPFVYDIEEVMKVCIICT